MINVITGPNFSGKSFYLQCYSRFPTERVRQAIKIEQRLFHDNRNDLYIGPIPDYFFSGFFSSVKSEVFRYRDFDLVHDPVLKEYIESMNLIDLYSRDPFTLSGGEKAIISTLSFAASRPRSLCIDCTLEQLSEDWKLSLLNLLVKLSLPEIILVDNRLAELPYQGFKKMEYNAIVEPFPEKMKLSGINSDCMNLIDDVKKTILYVNNLSFSYGKKELFKNFNLKLETGKIYHLKGKNGAGKSTLSKILSGLIKPDKKTGVFLNDKKVNLYNHPGKSVGYTFQQPDDQLFSKSVGEELGLIHNESSSSSPHIQSLIETFGLMPLLKLHPFELPVSMRKRLSIVAALSEKRPFYILDEPTLYMDDANVVELKQTLTKLASAGKGIVLISHSEKFIKSFNNLETIELNQH